MQAKRDNPACAKEEYDALLYESSGIQIKPSFSVAEVDETSTSNFELRTSASKPKIAFPRTGN